MLHSVMLQTEGGGEAAAAAAAALLVYLCLLNTKDQHALRQHVAAAWGRSSVRRSGVEGLPRAEEEFAQHGCDAGQSGLKVLVDGSDVGHDTLPVWSLCVHHLINVLE